MDERLGHLSREITEAKRRAQGESGFLLECSVDDETHEVHLAGDVAGLLHLASRLVDLAARETPGAHEHFDVWTESGNAQSLIVFKWYPQMSAGSTPPPAPESSW